MLAKGKVFYQVQATVMEGTKVARRTGKDCPKSCSEPDGSYKT